MKACCPTACGLRMPELPGVTTAAKERDEGPVASCCGKPQRRPCSLATWERKMGLTEIILGTCLIINHRFLGKTAATDLRGIGRRSALKKIVDLCWGKCKGFCRISEFKINK